VATRSDIVRRAVTAPDSSTSATDAVSTGVADGDHQRRVREIGRLVWRVAPAIARRHPISTGRSSLETITSSLSRPARPSAPTMTPNSPGSAVRQRPDEEHPPEGYAGMDALTGGADRRIRVTCRRTKKGPPSNTPSLATRPEGRALHPTRVGTVFRPSRQGPRVSREADQPRAG